MRTIPGMTIINPADDVDAQAAVLAAANLADELLKQQAAAENLRRQLKGYLDEANKAKAELGECKRQLLKLQQKK